MVRQWAKNIVGFYHDFTIGIPDANIKCVRYSNPLLSYQVRLWSDRAANSAIWFYIHIYPAEPENTKTWKYQIQILVKKMPKL